MAKNQGSIGAAVIKDSKVVATGTRSAADLAELRAIARQTGGKVVGGKATQTVQSNPIDDPTVAKCPDCDRAAYDFICGDHAANPWCYNHRHTYRGDVSTAEAGKRIQQRLLRAYRQVRNDEYLRAIGKK